MDGPGCWFRSPLWALSRRKSPRHALFKPILWCHIILMQQQALSAMVAWVRLDQALENFSTALRRRFGITGLQLAVLHILAERNASPLAALRRALVVHPATLGQAVEALRLLGLCSVTRNPRDRRARLVAITPEGLALTLEAPLAGPMRLRQIETEPARLDRLAAAFTDAVALFGIEAFNPDGAGALKPAGPDPISRTGS